MRRQWEMFVLFSLFIFASGVGTGMTLCETKSPTPLAAPDRTSRPPAPPAPRPPGEPETWTTGQAAAAGSCPQATAKAVYTRGALSTVMRDACEKEFDLKAGKYPLGFAYGNPAYRDYTFAHGEPKTCDEMGRVLREVGER